MWSSVSAAHENDTTNGRFNTIILVHIQVPRYNYLKLNDKWSINYIEIRPFELMDKIKIFFP